MSLTTKLTIVYEGWDDAHGKPFERTQDVSFDWLTIMGRADSMPAAVLAQVNLVKGAHYRIAIEMESEVTDMEKQDGVWCEVEDEEE